jgi:TonB family protein
MQPATRPSHTLLLACLCLFIVPYVNAQETAHSERQPIAFTSEGWGRSWATKQVLPVYPAEAIAQNIQGVVEVGVGIDDDGRVIKARVPPGLDPRLRRAAVAAARQWEFRPRADKLGTGEYGIFRLTFNFVIEEGASRVEMYNPPHDTPDHRRIRGASNRERKEWLRWEDAFNDQ